jgi:hypothetical protein
VISALATIFKSRNSTLPRVPRLRFTSGGAMSAAFFDFAFDEAEHSGIFTTVFIHERMMPRATNPSLSAGK